MKPIRSGSGGAQAPRTMAINRRRRFRIVQVMTSTLSLFIISAGRPILIVAVFPARISRINSCPIMDPHAIPEILAGYPAHLVESVLCLLAEGTLGEALERRYPRRHVLRSDRALYDYVVEIKEACLRNTPPLSKVLYDNSLQAVRQALGTHTRVFRVQGGKLKAKTRSASPPFFSAMRRKNSRMIVVHELAHLRVRDHSKEFFQLCRQAWSLRITSWSSTCASGCCGSSGAGMYRADRSTG